MDDALARVVWLIVFIILFGFLWSAGRAMNQTDEGVPDLDYLNDRRQLPLCIRSPFVEMESGQTEPDLRYCELVRQDNEARQAERKAGMYRAAGVCDTDRVHLLPVQYERYCAD